MLHDVVILVLLLVLVGISFYLGTKFTFNQIVEHAVDHVFAELEKEGIIRLVEENGEIEVYSGNKFYEDKS